MKKLVLFFLCLAELEEKLDMILKVRGEKALNQLRDNARLISKGLGMQKEFKKFNAIISALLSTHPAAKLTSTNVQWRMKGEPIDANRIRLFEKLYNSLAEKIFPYHPEKNKKPVAYRNFGFFESYFSNYIEGTVFKVEEAREIIRTQKPMQTRKEDSHDVLGTYKIVSDIKEMALLPTNGNVLLDILRYRHKVILAGRASHQPGNFKHINNYAGNTAFVDFKEVGGTLKKSFEYYTALRHPFAKAAYMMFVVSEVHPFLDGNGRVARIMMNAELSGAKQSKIIIPTVYRDDYMGALRKLTRQEDTETYIRMLLRAWEFSRNVHDDNIDEMQKFLKKCNAFEEHTEAKLKMVAR